MIYPQRRKHKASMRKECWLPSTSGLILLVRSESTLSNVFFQAPFVGHVKKWNAHEGGHSVFFLTCLAFFLFFPLYLVGIMGNVFFLKNHEAL